MTTMMIAIVYSLILGMTSFAMMRMRGGMVQLWHRLCELFDLQGWTWRVSAKKVRWSSSRPIISSDLMIAAEFPQMLDPLFWFLLLLAGFSWWG